MFFNKLLGKLALWWKEACEGTTFHGSFIISIKQAGSFAGGLAHALKYAGKFLSKDPKRLAALELAFHGVRRVHTLGAFYNALPKPEAEAEEPKSCDPSCPDCGAALIGKGPLVPIFVLKREGCVDLDEAKRKAARLRILRGVPDESG